MNGMPFVTCSSMTSLIQRSCYSSTYFVWCELHHNHTYFSQLPHDVLIRLLRQLHWRSSEDGLCPNLVSSSHHAVAALWEAVSLSRGVSDPDQPKLRE
ncbi:hypothetical protein PAXRUDRAFT_222075 [Paxillus rubicundulus Ve08.2h10]|uniref:Uncharacterized protein n=1 Tax=Paxillus rubicundulus Ve08.2h10 TaxID=930991 RepID=A0A0D0CYL4_9AGAM|nr:hypothetical protein PAXRUDRAFT_222075 [Paxillus rubicundulus Ve08.2h10]